MSKLNGSSKNTNKDRSFLNIMRDGLSSVGGLIVDVGSDIASPIYDKHLDSRIEQDTKRIEQLCDYARLTGNRIFLHYSPKYENVQCFAFLLTDGDTRLLVDGHVLINLIQSGILVVSGCGLSNEYGNIAFISERRLKESKCSYNWVVPPIEFPKEQCSNLRIINRSMKQHLR